MFPTSHDITPENVEEAIGVLRAYTAAGNKVLVVSKPRPECIDRLVQELSYARSQITFRFSIGSADDRILRFWEPGAPSFAQRVEALRLAFNASFETSVSCEPMLDRQIGVVIQAVRPYVTDTIWLGRANKLLHAVALNCPGNEEVRGRARALLNDQPDEWLRELHFRYKSDPMIRFKDSIKKAVGMERPVVAGLDQ